MSNSPVTPTLQATDSRPREQYQDSDSQATRHVCAGVYVDRSFRDLVIRKVHNNSQRRVAPSYGFDLVPVVRHAWQIMVPRPRAPGGALSVSLVLGRRLAVVLVVCVIFVCLMLRVAARIIAETFQAQVAAVAEDWFERRKFRIRPETPGSPFLTTQAGGILASASNFALRKFLDPTSVGTRFQGFDYRGD